MKQHILWIEWISRIHTFRVDSKSRRVDGLVALDDIAVLIHKDEVRDTDLWEVHRQRIQPEVVSQDGIANRDVPCDALVVAAVCETAWRFQLLFL